MFVCFSSTDHYFKWNGCNWTNRRKGKYHLYFYSVLVVVVVDVHFFPIHHVHERVRVCTLPISVHATFMYFIKLILLLFSLVSCNFPFGDHSFYCHVQIEKKALLGDTPITLQCINVP